MLLTDRRLRRLHPRGCFLSPRRCPIPAVQTRRLWSRCRGRGFRHHRGGQGPWQATQHVWGGIFDNSLEAEASPPFGSRPDTGLAHGERGTPKEWLRPAQRRELVAALSDVQVSCRLDQTPSRHRIREWGHARPRCGYLRIWPLLCRAGCPVNRKLVRRLCRLEGLQVRPIRTIRISPSQSPGSSSAWLPAARRFVDSVMTGPCDNHEPHAGLSLPTDAGRACPTLAHQPNTRPRRRFLLLLTHAAPARDTPRRRLHAAHLR
jgi:hypothetical protein